MILGPKKLLKSLAYMMSGSGLVLVVSFLITIFLARLLEPAQLGLLVTAEAFIDMFRILFFFGFNNSIFKMAALDSEGFQEGLNKAIGNAFLIKVLMIPVIAIAVLGSAHLFLKDQTLLELVYGYLFIYFLEAFSAIYGIVRRARGEFKLVSGILILNKVLRLLTIVIVLKFIGGIRELIIAFLLEKIIRLLISYFSTRNLVKPKIEMKTLKELFWHSFGYAFVDPLQGIQTKVDSLMLNSMLGPVAVAIYAIPSKFITAIRTVMETFTSVFTPNLHAAYEKDKAYFDKMVNKSNRFIALIGLVSFVCIFYFSDFVIMKFFGHKYQASLAIAQLFSYITLINIVERPSELVMISLAVHGQRVFYKTLSIVMNIGLNLVLIAKYGVAGCVYATIIANGVRLLVKFYLCRKQMDNIIILLILVPACILANFVSWYILLPVYAIYLVLIKAIEKDDLKYVKTLIEKRKQKSKIAEIENEESREDI